MNSIHFEWRKEYSVGVKEIDAQHKGLIKVMDDLYQSANKKNSREIIFKTLKKLEDYAKYHFDTEEKYFKKFKYKFSKAHSAQHNKFKKDIAKMAKLAKEGKLGFFELLFFMENWWLNHILSSDKKYSEFFNGHGLK